MSTLSPISSPLQAHEARPGLPSGGCGILYQRFDLLTASEIVIDWYVGGAQVGDFTRVSREELGQACMNTLMLCHEAPEEHCDLVSSLLSPSSRVMLEDCLPGVLALREFALQSFMLMEHDPSAALAH